MDQKHWRIEFVNGGHEVVFGTNPHVSRDGHTLIVRELYGVTGMEKNVRQFVLSNVITWTETTG